MANLVAQTSIINHTSQLYGSLSARSSTFEVVALGTDKYVVTYSAGTSYNFSAGSGDDIRAEIWNMDGTLAVSHFFIPEIRGGDQSDLSVVETPGGGFTAAWRAGFIYANGGFSTNGNIGAADTVRMARFGVDGARIGDEVVFEPGGNSGNNFGVALAYSDNVQTSFPLVAGSASNFANGSTYVNMVVSSQLAPNFTIVSGTFIQFHYQMVERSGPALTVAWYEQDNINGQYFIKGGIINGINQPIHSEWLVPLTPSSNGAGTNAGDYSQDRSYEVTVLATGETVVGYDDLSGGDAVKFRIFNQDGTGGGTPFLVSVDESTEALNADEEGIAVHALNDGGFVAAWLQLGYTNAAGVLVQSGLYMRTYDNLGNPTGAATLVTPLNYAMSYVDIDIDVGDDGAIVIGWIEYSSFLGTGGTYSRVFRETANLIGTEGDDVLGGTTSADTFDGLGGFDFASYALALAPVTASLQTPASNTGQAANDTFNSIEGLVGSSFGDSLTGDANTNVINGGNGGDTINGGLGNDALDGGAGNDLIYFDAADTASNIFGGADFDTLFVASSVTTTPLSFNLAAQGFEQAQHDEIDSGAAFTWGTRTTFYANQWVKTLEIGVYDSAADNGDAYTYNWTAGLLTNFIYYDNGANDKAYQNYTISYNASGQQISVVGLNDNNNTFTTSIDNAGLAWSSITANFNAGGQALYSNTSYDNGDSAVANYINGVLDSSTVYDTGADDQFYQHYTINYNAAGIAFAVSGINNDGSSFAYLV